MLWKRRLRDGHSRCKRMKVLSETTARLLYRVLGGCALPWVLWRLWRRGHLEPGYRQHLLERFGYYRDLNHAGQHRVQGDPVKRSIPLIWIHAVSVGETRAAVPLIQALYHQYPEAQLLLTHMTATGRQTARQLFDPATHPRLKIATLPYDYPGAIQRFYHHFKPSLGLILETELWPHLCHEALRLNIPLFLLNARLSERALKRYQRWPALVHPLVRTFQTISAQSLDEAERFKALGARRVVVCPNLKFDARPAAELIERAQQWRERIGQRPVWVLASSHEGEENDLLEALLATDWPKERLLVIVPRHPPRFDKVAGLLQQQRWPFERRSLWNEPAVLKPEIPIVLGDTIGELFSWYALADFALIGGSLQPLGGQNLIEAAAVGCPSLIGPHTFNFQAICDAAIDGNAAIRVHDAADAVRTADTLFREASRLTPMRQAAKRFANQHQGGAQCTIRQLPERLS